MAGCSTPHGTHGDDAEGASTDHVDEARAQYRLEVDAPRPLKRLLAEHLDLARFRDAPASAGLTDEELDRLIATTPEQARALLGTEGYFNAQVRASREPAQAGQRPLVRVQVDPGPRTVVGSVALQASGELRQRADAHDAQARALIESLEAQWLLKPGRPFRQDDWTDAKTASLGQLHGNGYPAASWLHTEARVHSKVQTVDLEAAVQSGPLFHLGELQIRGLQRYDDRVVRNVAPFSTGAPYSEQRLRDFQDRLQRTGLFSGAVAEIDPDPAKAAATPVTVRVQEEQLQKVVLGLGYSSDTGTRATLEHTHRQPFGLRWVALDKLELGPQRKAWDFDFRSYPQRGFQRNVIGGMVERWSGPDEERFAGRLRLGRSWEDRRLERHLYAEYNTARVRPPVGEHHDARSLTANLDWTRRDVDSLLLPTDGHALVLQSAVGYSRSADADNGPFGRAYGRLHYFRPFATHWHAGLRLEVGQIFARQGIGVPDTLLFRAGGEDSVRGYGYRSLGPKVDGITTSGRALLTASAEVARPVSQRLPMLWGAAFIDAGNAAQRMRDLKPAVGVGVGVRYRSPVGPVRFDVAYGVDAKQVRMHLSAGVSF